MTYGRGQVALAGPSAAELDLDVLCGEFKALKKERVQVSKMKNERKIVEKFMSAIPRMGKFGGM